MKNIMKFLNWFKKLFSTEKPAETMPEQETSSFENVVVGEILEIRKHPNADRLRLVKVNIGDKELEVVCGAPNIEVGQKVPVALVGAKLPSGIEIREAEIRGVKSCGMLCAKDELSLGNDHSGIMILGGETEVGMKFAKYVSLNK